MLQEVAPNLYVGNGLACNQGQIHEDHEILNNPHATVHAAKHPCHARALVYTGSLPKDHPFYLVFRQDPDLYLNLIDPDVPLFKPELFWGASRFIADFIRSMPVIIHCVSGQSRAPSIALIYLVKNNLTGINKLDYQANDQWMLDKYPMYNPGKGIVRYLRENWELLLNDRPQVIQNA